MPNPVLARRVVAVVAVAVVAVAGVAVAGVGCDGKRVAEYPARRAMAGKANLPPTPDLDPPRAPERFPDGAWSVRGVMAAAKSAPTDELSVRATVAALYPCPVTESLCKPAPHLWLTDARNGVGKRLLVGGERDLERRGLAIGQEVTLRGKFATSSADGLYFAPQGLLLLTPLDPADGTGGNAGPDAGGSAH